MTKKEAAENEGMSDIEAFWQSYGSAKKMWVDYKLKMAKRAIIYWENAETEARKKLEDNKVPEYRKSFFELIADMKKYKKEALADLKFWESEAKKLGGWVQTSGK